MAITYANFDQILGAELRAFRGVEAAWEWFKLTAVSPTYFRDFINAGYINTRETEDKAETRSKDSIFTNIQPQLEGMHSARKADFETYFFEFLDIQIPTGAADRVGAISYEYDPTLLADGQVSISGRVGRLAALRADMIANSETVLNNTVSESSAFAGDSGNVGSAVAGSIVRAEHMLTGEFVFEVTDDTVGATFFSAVNTLAAALIEDITQVSTDNPIKLGKASEDGPTGLTITLSFDVLLKTGDDGVIFSTLPVITNPSEADSAKGFHFIEVERLVVGGGGPHFRVRWFRSGSLLDTDKVVELDVTGETGTQVINLLGSSSSISVTIDLDAAVIKLPVATNKDSDIVFNIQQPRIGDKFRMSVSNNENGNFQTKTGRLYRISFPSSGSPTFTDAEAASVPMT